MPAPHREFGDSLCSRATAGEPSVRRGWLTKSLPTRRRGCFEERQIRASVGPLRKKCRARRGDCDGLPVAHWPPNYSKRSPHSSRSRCKTRDFATRTAPGLIESSSATSWVGRSPAVVPRRNPSLGRRRQRPKGANRAQGTRPGRHASHRRRAGAPPRNDESRCVETWEHAPHRRGSRASCRTLQPARFRFVGDPRNRRGPLSPGTPGELADAVSQRNARDEQGDAGASGSHGAGGTASRCNRGRRREPRAARFTA